MRARLTIALAATLILCTAGCGKRAAPPVPEPAETGGVVQITLHVKNMTKALNITWREWPNRVEEALSGLPGVWVLDRDVLKDDIPLRYDAGQITPERIVEVVRKEGFEGTVASDKPSAGGDNR